MNEQVKTLHFWLGLIGIGIPAAMEGNIIPAGSVYERIGRLVMALVTYIGIQSAAKWLPSRVVEKLDEHSAAKIALATAAPKIRLCNQKEANQSFS